MLSGTGLGGVALHGIGTSEAHNCPSPTPRPSAIGSTQQCSHIESRLDACINRNRLTRDVLVNNATLHYKDDAANGRDVFQRVRYVLSMAPQGTRHSLSELLHGTKPFEVVQAFEITREHHSLASEGRDSPSTTES